MTADPFEDYLKALEELRDTVRALNENALDAKHQIEAIVEEITDMISNKS